VVRIGWSGKKKSSFLEKLDFFWFRPALVEYPKEPAPPVRRYQRMHQNGASLSSTHRSKVVFDRETEFLHETRFLLARSRAMIGQRSLLLAGILAGFALRLFHLGAESLWYDETVSVHLARLPLPTMLTHTAGDIHPPGLLCAAPPLAAVDRTKPGARAGVSVRVAKSRRRYDHPGVDVRAGAAPL
jgi:hypothetical protein